jgi:hypothetical protein
VSPPNPGDEATLELLGIERREDVAELVVRRCAVLEWPEAAQELELLLAEPLDLDPALATRQHAEQHQQQHLIEQIEHLAALARVLKRLKRLQKIDNPVKGLVRLRCRRPSRHGRGSPREPRGHPHIQHSLALSSTD